MESTKKMNWARWIARILSSLFTLIWSFIFIAELLTNYFDEGGAFTPTGGAIAVFIFLIITSAGTIIGWWNEKWGGLILIAGYFASAIGGYIMAVSQAHNKEFIPVILYLPFLISGVLYLLYWRKNN